MKVKNYHRGKFSNLSNWKEEAWKICDDHSLLSSTTAVQIWISYIFHIISLHWKTWPQQIDLASNVWLHSSVGRASHRYRGGNGFESCGSPDIFQASSFQFLKLENLLRWSFSHSYVGRRCIWCPDLSTFFLLPKCIVKCFATFSGKSPS